VLAATAVLAVLVARSETAARAVSAETVLWGLTA